MASVLALTRRLVDAAATVLLLSLLACVVLGVASRSLNMPLAWTDEMAQHLLVWTGCVGWMIAARRRSHIRINVFIDRLPRLPRLGVEIIIQLSVIAFALALLRFMPAVIQRNLDIEWISLPISAALLYIPVPFAALSLIVNAIAEITDALRGHTAPPQEPGAMPL